MEWFLIISLVLAISLFYLGIWIIRFQPTKLYISKHFRLWRISNHFENVDKLTKDELEWRLMLLLLDRSGDGLARVNEKRNGIRLHYYPDTGWVNKRAMEMDYVEICDDRIGIVLRVGFGAENKTQYQIEYKDREEIYERMFFRSSQGTLYDLHEAVKNEVGRCDILYKYRDWLLREIL